MEGRLSLASHQLGNVVRHADNKNLIHDKTAEEESEDEDNFYYYSDKRRKNVDLVFIHIWLLFVDSVYLLLLFIYFMKEVLTKKVIT